MIENFDYENIRDEILNRKMIECDFTTVLWRVFLHCLPRDSNQWEDILDTSRRSYEKLLEKHTIDPYKMTGEENDIKNLNHPLSHDENVTLTSCHSFVIQLLLILEFVGTIFCW